MKSLLSLLKNDTQHPCIATIHETQSSCNIVMNILDDMLLYDKIESRFLKLEVEYFSPWLFFEATVKPYFVEVST
jgi:hypothetical protein